MAAVAAGSKLVIVGGVLGPTLDSKGMDEMRERERERVYEYRYSSHAGRP